MATSGRGGAWRQPRPPGWALRPAAAPELAVSPEPEPAAAREEELRDLQARIRWRERLLTALLTRLGPFEYRYQERMGERYARLFELFVLIDEERKRRSARAEEAASAAVAAGARSSSRVLEPSANGHRNGGGDGLGPSLQGPIDRPVRRLF